MDFIAWIVVGALAGYIASHITNAKSGIVAMVGLGIVGGLLGGWLAANVFKMGGVDGINFESVFIATLGAIAVVFIANLVSGNGRLGRRVS